MRVRALYSHCSSDGVEHAAGTVYDLADGSDELALRVKDHIVVADGALPIVPDVARTLASLKAESVATVAARESAPPANPEE